MIARVWKGWTTVDNADAYETLLKQTVYPGLRKIGGYRGGYILRRAIPGNEVEFVTVNLFDSLDSIKRFAGIDYETPVFEPQAMQLLSKAESIAHHYEVRESL